MATEKPQVSQNDPVPVPRGETRRSNNPPAMRRPNNSHLAIVDRPMLKSKPKRKPDPPKRHYCRRICCCLFTTLLLLVIAVTIAAGIIYFAFRPTSPSYSVNSISIHGLNLSSPTFNSGFLSPRIRTSITAVNPNKWISFHYREAGSSVNFYYYKRHLCWGKWPAFHQGTKNETVVHMDLQGKEVRMTASEEHWMKKEEKDRTVPLKLLAEIPMKIELARKMKLWKMTIKLDCDLTVNVVSPAAKVVSRVCGYKVDVM